MADGYDFCYLSLGAGVQFTALLVMANLELKNCPRPDVAIFADTGDEPAWVYEHLAWLEKWSQIPVYRTSAGMSLSSTFFDMAEGRKKRFASIPCFTMGADGRPSILRRQCTKDFKIAPLERKAREFMGFKKGERITGKKKALCMIGISLDEVMRAKPARTPWITSSHPLLDARMTRRDCVVLLKEKGIPVPRKSACVFCPFHDDLTWGDFKRNHPQEWAKVVDVDRVCRNLTQAGVRQPTFLHRSLKPIDEVDFSPVEDGQLNLFNMECEGMCGV